MVFHLKLVTATAVVLLGACSAAAAGGYRYVTSCPHGPGSCIPQRTTFGYYPTSWRRWPTDGRGSAAKAEPEPVPVPPAAKELPAPEGAKSPTIAPQETPERPVPQPPPSAPIDEMPSLPAEPGPSKTEPMELPFTPPGEDVPPEPPRSEQPSAEPPRATPGPSKPSPLDRLLEPAAPTEITPDDSQSPAQIPEESHSGDEPSPNKSTPSDAAPTKGAGGGPMLPRTEPQSAFHWHGARRKGIVGETEKKDVIAPAEAPITTDASQEPRRLPPLNVGPTRFGAAALARANPLRSLAPQPADDRVVPTANWTAVRPIAESVVEGSRSNPLRTIT